MKSLFSGKEKRPDLILMKITSIGTLYNTSDSGYKMYFVNNYVHSKTKVRDENG